VKRRDFLEQWGLSGLKLSLPFVEAEFAPRDPDRAAAWELYVELLTRIATQRLAPGDGAKRPRSTASTPCSRSRATSSSATAPARASSPSSPFRC
jgi:hypothetical protein